MPSVCFVHKDIGDVDRGGLCVLFKSLIDGFVRLGWKVCCITQRQYTREDIDVFRLEPTIDPILYSKRVRDVITSLKPDIAECSNWKFELLEYLRYDAGLSGTKTVVRCDPTAETLFGNRELSFYESELCHRAHALVAVSKFAKKDIERHYKVKVGSMVYNGIDIGQLRSYPHSDYITSGTVTKGMQNLGTKVRLQRIVLPGKINVFWCGKSTKAKGFDYLEKIVEVAAGEFNFIINLGISPAEVVWKKTNRDKCLFVGELKKEDQTSILRACDVFLSTSRVEGFGLALAESLGLGIPVVANSNCAVIREFLPNKAIALVDCDRPGEIMVTLQTLSKRKSVNKCFLDKKFSAAHMINETARVYQELIR